MIRIVIDASITGVFLLSDEITDHSAAIRAQLLRSDLIFAAHWQLEVASILVKAVRRQRLPPADRTSRLAEVDEMLAAGRVEGAATPRAIFDLAMLSGLTVYDAVYLELAERLDATLATNDDALIAVARTRGVPVLTTRR